MRRLLVQILCITKIFLCSANSPSLSEDSLTNLSAAGEKYVNEQIKESLLRVKQVKEKMEKEEEKHKHLMEEVKHSGDKKRGAMQLARETEQKLEEAERQCRDLTKSFFGDCRPCLEDSCKAFFTSTCRRGYASFVFKVEEFFRKTASQLEATELNSDKVKSGSAESQIKEDETDVELLQADAAFTQLLSDMSDLYNHSIGLMKSFQHVLGPSLLEAFTSELQSGSTSASPDESDGGFLRSWGLDRVFYSAFEFGKDVLEELSSTVEDVFEEIQEADEYFHHSNRDAESLSSFGQHPNGYLCRTLRRQASECWQLQSLCETCGNNLIRECPRLQQLHSEMEEMHTLLNVSRLQYDDRLQLVRRHAAGTQRWLGDTRDEYGWISRVANVSGAQSSIFRVITVNLQQQQQLRTNSPRADSSVVVSILDSAPLTVSVPADLTVEDPAFMEYIAHHALTLYKQQIRGTN
ncbi:PREDICTED: clusterin-like protein 1 [Poecilia mexicana]|uniref:clusterin-like protein 1 n=1 Tax=Poecilia mexicana TaxID=48701 RepID=UPI00072E811A|nr:PREDICTED: clusterin-like protein 1 [Poecilia mexicana]